MNLFAMIGCSLLLHTAKDTSGIRIEWDTATLIRVTPADGDVSNCDYARMIELHDHTLLCIYETSGNTACTRSTDGGKTWSQPVVVAAKKEGVNMSTPDVTELKDHSILAAYNPRPVAGNTAHADSSKHFAIRTVKSYDGGLSWKDDRLVYEAGYLFKNGCWEPALLQLPDGEVQLFFSNEGIYIHSDEQNISVFHSRNGGLDWSRQPQIASFSAGHRDGMPVPIVIPEKKEILFSIEDNRAGQFKPSIIRNTFSENWRRPVNAGSAERNAALETPLPDSVYAGAPFLRRLGTGETVLSYQSTENRTTDWQRSCMYVVTGDRDGRHFGNASMPFRIPPDKYGLWNALCILHDNTIIALTSTNAFSHNCAIWMIKGHVAR